MAVFKKLVNNASKKRILSLATFKKNYTTSESGDFIIKSFYPDVEVPNATIQDVVFENADKWSNKIAIECGVTRRKYTYDDIRIKSRNLSRALREKLKLTKGDVVAVILPNEPEYPIAVFGILKAGMVVTPMNPIYTAEEIARQLIDSNAKAIITLCSLCNTATEASKKTKKTLPIITIKTVQSEQTPQGTIDFRSFTDGSFSIGDLPPGDTEEVVILPYSSGTTGLPKGVQLTHRNTIANLVAFSIPAFKMHEDTTETHQDVVPAVLPMFHIYGFTTLTMQMLKLGCKIVTLPKFTPDYFISLFKDHRPNILFIVPPLVLFLTHHPSITAQDFDPVRIVMSGAAPLGALDEEKFKEKANKPINMLQGYGLTETAPVVASTTIEIKNTFKCGGSIGTPIPNTLCKVISIDDPTGKPLGPNQVGELLVKGPQVMKGYLNRPKETQETFLDGWLRTGDMVYYDENKLLYVTDRLKELIKVKGFQVPPAELEEIIRNYPGVADAAVIGIPHPTSGEIPRAYVVPKNNVTIKEEELQEFVAGKVADYKKLRGGVEIVRDIPKNPSGKILRRQLKLQYEAQNS